jgi:hypothetical protein
MQTACTTDSASLLAAKVKVPTHVTYRRFPSETVALNLETGKYHGLNVTAGRMLEELEQAASVAEALDVLDRSYDQPRELLERDMCELCRQLLERGLIEIERDSV